jgi:uncharacterized membrane protein YgcG
MRTMLTVIAVALVGLFGAASLGYAAYVVSRDQVGLPVTKLQTPPGKLAPTPAKTPKKPAAKRKRVVPPPPPPPPPPSTTTREPGDDHGGSRGGSGSGHGRGGGGDDD